MGLEEILILIGLILTYSTLLISAWISVRLKIKELDIRINKIEYELKEYCNWGEKQMEQWSFNLKEIRSDVKDYNEKLSVKLDNIITRFDDFRVDVEKRIH